MGQALGTTVHGWSDTKIDRRRTARWTGMLFLAAFGFYGGGALIVDDIATAPDILAKVGSSQTQLRVGVLLIVANSIVIVAIGALMHRLAVTVSPAVRLAYLVARLFEGAFLAAGAALALLLIPATKAGDADLARVLTEANDVFYQTGMIGLCAGSVPLCWALLKTGTVPRWLGWWGVAGYAIFGVGAALEIFGIGAGVILSVPGGIFELIFATYLIRKGLPAEDETDRLSQIPAPLSAAN